MTQYKIVNGVQIELTADEIAEIDARKSAWESGKEDRAWKALREARDRLLVESDWTQIADAPVDKITWATYRQALRDLPENTADVFNPVYPTKPEFI